MLWNERKLGDPRTDNGCKEFDRSMVMGDSGGAAIDAADGRRAIYIRDGSRRPSREENRCYVSNWECFRIQRGSRGD